MTNITYAKAYTEVLEIISHFPEEEYARIPVEKIEFYQKNMDKNYNFTINPEIDFEIIFIIFKTAPLSYSAVIVN